MLSVKSLTETQRLHFCVASFPQERLKDLQGAVTEKVPARRPSWFTEDVEKHAVCLTAEFSPVEHTTPQCQTPLGVQVYFKGKKSLYNKSFTPMKCQRLILFKHQTNRSLTLFKGIPLGMQGCTLKMPPPVKMFLGLFKCT